MSFRELTGRALTTFLRTLADTNFTCSSLVLLGRQVCREDTAPGRPLPTGVLARASPGPQLPFPGCAAHTRSLSHTHTITHAHAHNSGSWCTGKGKPRASAAFPRLCGTHMRSLSHTHTITHAHAHNSGSHSHSHMCSHRTHRGSQPAHAHSPTCPHSYAVHTLTQPEPLK